MEACFDHAQICLVSSCATAKRRVWTATVWTWLWWTPPHPPSTSTFWGDRWSGTSANPSSWWGPRRCCASLYVLQTTRTRQQLHSPATLFHDSCCSFRARCPVWRNWHQEPPSDPFWETLQCQLRGTFFFFFTVLERFKKFSVLILTLMSYFLINISFLSFLSVSRGWCCALESTTMLYWSRESLPQPTRTRRWSAWRSCVRFLWKLCNRNSKNTPTPQVV